MISGGNFHAEPVAMAADNMALAIAEIGLPERAPYLVDDGQAHVATAAVSGGQWRGELRFHDRPGDRSRARQREQGTGPSPQRRQLADLGQPGRPRVHGPRLRASVCGKWPENTRGILAVEWLAACQGLDLRDGLKTSPKLEKARGILRGKVAFYDKDRFFAPDINAASELLASRCLNELVPAKLLPSL